MFLINKELFEISDNKYARDNEYSKKNNIKRYLMVHAGFFKKVSHASL